MTRRIVPAHSQPVARASAHRVGPGRPSRAEALRRETALLDVAADLIARHGYRSLSLAAIAREAHVAARTIYVKFGGKAGLLAAVVEHTGDRILEDVPDLSGELRPVRAALEDFACAYLWAVTRPAALALRRTIIAEAAAFPEVAHAYFDRGPARAQAQLTAYFQRSDVRRALAARMPAAALAAACQTALLCDEYRRLLFALAPAPSRPMVAAWARRAVALFLDGARATLRSSSG